MAEESGVNDSPNRNNPSGKIISTSHRRLKLKKNRRKKQESTKTAFKGPLVGYEVYVYGVLRNKSSDAFSTTTCKLSEYISRRVQNAEEFMNAMNPDDLGFGGIEEPDDQ